MFLSVITFSAVSLSYILQLFTVYVFKITNIYDNETALNVIADKNIGCEVNVVYVPPEDGLVKAETYVGVEE